jgi:hypothetical protein
MCLFALLLRVCSAHCCRALADHAARNSVTGVSGRIGHVVVFAAVNHHCAAAGMEEELGFW